MALPLDLARRIQSETPDKAWRTILNYAWSVCAEPIAIDRANERSDEAGARTLSA